MLAIGDKRRSIAPQRIMSAQLLSPLGFTSSFETLKSATPSETTIRCSVHRTLPSLGLDTDMRRP
eukprot:3900623-Pyramimonas_sp.AAC.1